MNMRIVAIHDRAVSISRYADPTVASNSLTTSIVALVTNVLREGKPVVGYGFSSMGRYAQNGLIRERFAPRLLQCAPDDLLDEQGHNLDPFKAWRVMMQGEKPGGHGERSVAVGTLDMALWDAAAKIARQPLWRFLARRVGREPTGRLPTYASGGYPYPERDGERLADEIRRMADRGYTHFKIKLGGQSIANDIARIETVLALLPSGAHLAVDAMNRYSPQEAERAASALAPYGLWWFEDICDPLDFETHARLARVYPNPIAAGEALFSAADIRNLLRYGGLRSHQDVLVVDPVHSYGVPEYLRIVELSDRAGWPRSAHRPHGGHLFTAHLAAALGLGATESNPLSFQPFGGFDDLVHHQDGILTMPESPGIGFEAKAALRELLVATAGGAR